jgi:hypothetical protein
MQCYAIIVNFFFSSLHLADRYFQLKRLISLGFSIGHRSGRRTIAKPRNRAQGPTATFFDKTGQRTMSASTTRTEQ